MSKNTQLRLFIINNLRPICGACNHSMGAENMVDFVVKYGLYIG